MPRQSLVKMLVARHLEGASPLEEFLFNRKTGCCEHYATAMVIMLRTVGIPARLVTGFLATEWNEYGNYYVVRQQDAHAWVEVHLPQSGWVMMDPTPAVTEAPGPTSPAWQAFGRFTHTADFYAHSNYITLWVNRFEGQALPPPPEVDPMDPGLIASPNLRSGKVYFPLELLYFFPRTRQFSLRHLPKDSHAWMNLDTPEQGSKFDYAMHAATKRTVIEFEKTTEGFSEEMCRLFLDR